MWACSSAGRAPALQESRQNHTSAASGVAYAERRGATNPLNWTEVGPKTCLRSWGNARVRATRAGGHRFDPGHVHHFLLGITAFPPPVWGTDTILSLRAPRSAYERHMRYSANGRAPILDVATKSSVDNPIATICLGGGRCVENDSGRQVPHRSSYQYRHFNRSPQ